MDSNQQYWSDVPDPTYKRIKAAWNQLDAIGFEFDEEFRFAWRKAAENFYPVTLWKVFALGQILEREQPIPVRGAMYGSVATLEA